MSHFRSFKQAHDNQSRWLARDRNAQWRALRESNPWFRRERASLNIFWTAPKSKPCGVLVCHAVVIFIQSLANFLRPTAMGWTGDMLVTFPLLSRLERTDARRPPRNHSRRNA
jgi:hypothetical protein